MDKIFALVFLAFVIERLTELLLSMLPVLDVIVFGEVELKRLIPLPFGLLFAYGAYLDFFSMFGIAFQWPVVGPAVTALILAGGSSVVHDIISYSEKRKETL